MEKFDTYYEKICRKPNNYKGIDINKILFEYYWYKFLNLEANINIYKHFIKITLGIFFKFLKKPKLIKNFRVSEAKFKKLVILTFSEKNTPQNGINEILENLLKEFDKDDIILVIFNKVTYLKYKKMGYKIIYLKIPKYYISYENYTLCKNESRKIFKLDRCLKIIDLMEEVLDKIEPEVIITTQDYYYEDYIFTSLAKKYNIPTVTHQHGFIFENDKAMAYKYYYSDYVMVWGERDVKILEKYLKNSKIIAVGTDKFKKLLDNRKIEKLNLTLAMTDISNSKEEEEILKYFCCIKTELSKKIKLHPSINKERMIKKYKNILKEVELTYDYGAISEAKYLLTYKTTALIDGLCCGAYVLDISTNIEDTSSTFVHNILQKKVYYKDLEGEIKKIEKNKNYALEVFVNQEEVLGEIIKSFDSTKFEKKIIENIGRQ